MNCGVSLMYVGRRWPHPRSSQVFSRVPVVGLSFPLDNDREEIPTPSPTAVTSGLPAASSCLGSWPEPR